MPTFPALDDIVNDGTGLQDLPSDRSLEEVQQEGQYEQPSRSNERVQDNRQWYMVVAEDTPSVSEGARITGQFTPQQVSQNISSNIVEAGGLSRASPIIQWVGGQIRTFTFQARLFSLHTFDDTAERKLEQLEFLMRPSTNLKRPPLVNFYWGNAIPLGFPCFIESLGGVTYDEIRQDRTIRGVTLNITLKKFTQFRIEQVPTTQTERTPIHIVKDGETYEMIALRRYGDPLLGVLLRQRNDRFPMRKKGPKAIADLQSSEEVKLFSVTEMKREDVRPQCHILREDNFIIANNRRRFFNLRSQEVAAIPRK